MAVTPTQIAEQALRELNALDAGQIANADDVAAVNVAACVAMLKAKGAVDLTADLQNSAIDDAFLLPLARYCAGRAAPSFGVTVGDAVALERIGEREVRHVAALAHVYEPVKTEYF